MKSKDSTRMLQKLAETVIEASLSWTGEDEEKTPALKRARTLAGLATNSVAVKVVCRPCEGCGDPFYVDGCLKCGNGIDGRFVNNWFDIDDMDHLRAYKQLIVTGCWPEGFIPDDVKINPGWATTLAFGMANAYVMLKMG